MCLLVVPEMDLGAEAKKPALRGSTGGRPPSGEAADTVNPASRKAFSGTHTSSTHTPVGWPESRGSRWTS
jgi:hypothetical protein